MLLHSVSYVRVCMLLRLILACILFPTIVLIDPTKGMSRIDVAALLITIFRHRPRLSLDNASAKDQGVLGPGYVLDTT